MFEVPLLSNVPIHPEDVSWTLFWLGPLFLLSVFLLSRVKKRSYLFVGALFNLALLMILGPIALLVLGWVNYDRFPNIFFDSIPFLMCIGAVLILRIGIKMKEPVELKLFYIIFPIFLIPISLFESVIEPFGWEETLYVFLSLSFLPLVLPIWPVLRGKFTKDDVGMVFLPWLLILALSILFYTSWT